MGEELAKKFETDVELIPGSGGALEVSVDGREIFSKKKIGHFPTADELSALIRQP